MTGTPKVGGPTIKKGGLKRSGGLKKREIAFDKQSPASTKREIEFAEMTNSARKRLETRKRIQARRQTLFDRGMLT